MTHARRKIHNVHVRTPTDITTEALRHTGELYAIEAEIRGSPPVQRLSAKNEDGAADEIAVRLVPNTDKNAVAPRGDSEEVRLPVEALECVEPLLQERQGGNRQQYCRERPAQSRAGAIKWLFAG